ncbi:MAG: hypothetical protein ACT4PT_03280 [Methanobacteriota archaeon]
MWRPGTQGTVWSERTLRAPALSARLAQDIEDYNRLVEIDGTRAT